MALLNHVYMGRYVVWGPGDSDFDQNLLSAIQIYSVAIIL